MSSEILPLDDEENEYNEYEDESDENNDSESYNVIFT